MRDDRDRTPSAVAIVGMAGRFPGAPTLDRFWQNVATGTESITALSRDQLRSAGVPENLIDHPDYVAAAPLLEGFDLFDAEFFQCGPREATLIDPQQRVFLEIAREALEVSGHLANREGRSIGVFGGSGGLMSSYLLSDLHFNWGLTGATASAGHIGNDKDFLCTRVSYKLDLRGPSITVQTACSTSLVAVHMACQSLLAGECDIALAGGVTIRVPHYAGYLHQQDGILSPDGHCRPFDANARGTLFGSGAGVVVLRPLEEALADGDNIRAVILGSAIANDGARKTSFWATRAEGQIAAIRGALAVAQVDSATIGLIEAHGTGTLMGDPVEIMALDRAYRSESVRAGRCAVGSVKANIGHLEAAAGIAGLIKAVLALENREIPPAANFDTANPKIDFSSTPFEILHEGRSWDAPVRRAAVNSLGVGGTNVHVILEESPSLAPRPKSPERPELLVLSARTKERLGALARSVRDHVADDRDENLPDICYTALRARPAEPHRIAITATSQKQAANALDAYLRGSPANGLIEGVADHDDRLRVAFLFADQGTAYTGVCHGLYKSEPIFRAELERCGEILEPHLDVPLLSLLYGTPDETLARRTAYMQPAIFSLEWSLAQLWMSWGVRPQALLGHGVGEYVAACVAGVFDVKDGLTLAAARGRLMDALPNGTVMAAVMTDKTSIEEAIAGNGHSVAIAAENASRMVVIAGTSEDVSALADPLSAQGVASVPLAVSHAFHSLLTDPILDEFKTVARRIPMREPSIPLISNVTGTLCRPGEIASAGYWVRQLRSTVQFRRGVEALAAHGIDCLLEVGPPSTLLGLARQSLNGASMTYLPSLGPSLQDRETMLASAGRLFAQGADIDLRQIYSNGQHRVVPLPPTPLQRKRYWIESAATKRPDTITPPVAKAVNAGQRYDRTTSYYRRELGGDGYMTLHVPNVDELIALLAEKGVQLWADGDQLRVRAPKGVLNAELPDLLAQHKAALLRKLQERASEAVDASLPVLTPKPEQRHEPFPLNDIQLAYWVGRSGAVELGNVTTHAYMEIDGSGLDLERLSAALQKLILRQDMLRVIVLSSGDQRILSDVPPYQMPVVDLSTKSDGDAAVVLEAIREEMSHQVLAFDHWPLFDIRATLMAGGRTRLHVSIDLIIMDLGSLHTFMREWEYLYLNPDEPLPPLEITFRDFLMTEREIERTELFKRSERYWLDRLETLPPRPQLPLVTNGAAIENQRFTRRHFTLDEKTWASLKERARRAELTSSGLLLAAFAEVLEFWSQSPRFTLNLTLYNRLPLHPQVNQVIGNSISVILLAADNSAADTFAERAKRLQQQLWQDLDHSYMSGVRVLRELGRKQGHAPSALMPVVFTSVLGLEGLGNSLKSSAFGETVYSISQTPQVWLDHQVLEDRGALSTSWDAVEDLFPEGLLDDMFEAYRRLLEGLAAEDALWHAKQTTTLPARQVAIRAVANATETPRRDGMLHTALAAHAQTSGDSPAVIAPGRTLSYKELFEASNRLARWLRQSGVRPNAPVAVVTEKGWEQIVAVMGVLASGAPYMPVDPAVPSQRLKFLLECGEVTVVLTQSHLDAGLQWPAAVKRLAVDTFDFSGFDAGPLETVQSPDDLAYVIFTSGSTGNPKGVMLDHRGPLNTIRFFNERFNVGPKDRALALSALNFDLSVYDVFGMLDAGGALVIPDPIFIKDPAHWAGLMAEHRVTVWNSVPTLMTMMVEHLSSLPKAVPSGLRLVVMAGDWIPVSLPDRIKALWPGIQVVASGGPTETSVWNVHYTIETVDPLWASIPYGRPIANNRYHVMDESLRHRPEWVPGELMAEGIGLARGYWRDTVATDARFVIDPDSGKRLYKTGDLGRYMSDGNLEILGRRDFQVKLDGYRIELGEIEAALRDHPMVREAVVSAVGEDRERRRLVAYVVANDATTSSPDSAQFKLEQHGLRRPEPHHAVVELPRRQFDKHRAAVYQGRRSTRTFLERPVPLQRISRLLDCLEQMKPADSPLPKYLYPSAGSLHPVQTYLHVKAARVEGLEEGTYYYDPSAHRLIQLERGARIGSAVHVEHNRSMYEQAAFALFLIAQMDAIVPIYGKELADRFCMLEAGYMGQALAMSAHEHEVGLCPIGALDYDAVRGYFHLDAGHVFLHSFVGGLEGAAEQNGSRHSPEDELRSFLREKLPEYMIPSAYVFLDALPLGANNKIDRRLLPDPSVALSPNRPENVMPRTDIERDLAQIVREVLGLESVGVHTTFFELGGTSVDLVKIHGKVRERLGRDISVVDLFRRPTINLLAEYLNQGDDGSALDRVALEAAKRREARDRRRLR